MKLEPAAPQSRVKHSTTEPLRSLQSKKPIGLRKLKYIAGYIFVNTVYFKTVIDLYHNSFSTTSSTYAISLALLVNRECQCNKKNLRRGYTRMMCRPMYMKLFFFRSSE